MADKNTLKNWFKTGLKPTQAQFWAWIDSYWHKDEKIPITAIDNIDGILNDKADAEALTNHVGDTAAHAALFGTKEDKSQKGVAGGYVPLDEFAKIVSDYLTIVNDLVTGGATALASAETVKTLKTQIDGINTLLTSDDVNLDTVQEIVTAIKTVQTSLSTILVNDLTTGGTTKALTAEMGKTLKGLIDALTTAKQAVLVSGENIKTINSITLLGSGNIITPDMDTTTAQSVSGLKTFLNNMFGFRNAANTFTSFFSNVNTASRTYTFQDRNGTLADLADIASVNTNKMNVPTGGIANYLPKFLTSTTQGLSRLWDTGTFLGIGTVNTPSKDLTFGNQANREIGIEESTNTVAGRDLAIRAGRTINYVPNVNFNALNQTSRTWEGLVQAANGDVYACALQGDIYKQTSGVGNFVSLSQTSRSWTGLAAKANGDILACVGDPNYGPGSIYKQIGGVGNFVSIGEPDRYWRGIAVHPNGDVYATSAYDNIYKQTGGVGSFISLGQTSRQWGSIACSPNGDVYATVGIQGGSGDIYKQTGGVGNFDPLSQTTRTWRGISCAPNGNVYATVSSDNGNVGDIYVQIAGLGNFIPLNQTLRAWKGLCFTSNGNAYASIGGFGGVGDIYLQNNDITGTANLDGGTLKHIAGTGKGTGKSRYEIWTGQKLPSGTDMQVETLREYIDENGYHVYTSMPVFADNAAALAGDLPVGCEYRTATGVKMIVY